MITWQLQAMGEICEILDRLRKPITKKNRVAGPVPYYGATGVLDHVQGYLFDERLVLLGEDGAKWGSGDISAFAITGKTWVNNHAHVIRPHRGVIMDEWLIHFLNFSDLGPFVSGMTVPKLNQQRMREIKIPVPPLPEQKRLVALLDSAFADLATATAHARQNLQNAKDLFQSTLQSTFQQKGDDWVETTLKEVTLKIGSGATPRGGQAAYKAEGISLIRSLNVHDRMFKSQRLAFIDDDQAKRLKNVVVEQDDVLLNITGASVARCCLAPKEHLPARVNQHVSIIRIKSDKTVPKFINFLLTSPPYKKRLLGIGDEGGSTRQAITKAQIQDFQISLPPLPTQKTIVEKLDALSAETRRLESLYQRKLDALAELKQSLLHQAFTGQL